MTEENQEFKAKTITKESEFLTHTIVIFDTVESIQGRKVTPYEQTFTYKITDKRRCLKLEKSSYPFYRLNRKTKKLELFFGYKIWHFQDMGSDICTQDITDLDEDGQYGFGISIVKSELKEITDKARLKEILTHCESNWSMFEGRLSQGSTKIVE